MLGLGTSLSSASFIDAEINYSLSFDGSNDEVDFTTSGFQTALAESGFKTSGSVSIWARLNTTGTNGQLWDFCIDTNNRINIQYKHNVTHKYVFMFKGGGSQKTAESGTLTHENDGNFHHIVCTWDNGDDNEIKLYIDGSLIDTTGLSTVELSGDFDDAASSSGVEVITGTSFNGNADLNGYLDDFAVYSSVLSASDVTTLYNSGTSNPSNVNSVGTCIAHWKFNEGTGTTVTDRINAFEGTLGTGGNAPTFSTDNAAG
jgi:hypothetical protein